MGVAEPMLQLYQYCRYGFPANLDCTSTRLRWSRFFIPFVPSKSSGPGLGQLCLLWAVKTWKYLIENDFSRTSPSHPLFLRLNPGLPAGKLYPTGTGSPPDPPYHASKEPPGQMAQVPIRNSYGLSILCNQFPPLRPGSQLDAARETSISHRATPVSLRNSSQPF